MESLFAFVHRVWNLHFFGNYVVEHIIIVLSEGNNFFMRLGVVEKVHWYGANRWSKNIFKVSFDFLFLDFFGFDSVHKHLYYKVHFLWFLKCHYGTSNSTHNVKCMFHFPCLKVLLLINWMLCLWMWYKVIVCEQIPNMWCAIHVDAWVTHKLHVGKSQMRFVWYKKNWVVFMSCVACGMTKVHHLLPHL